MSTPVCRGKVNSGTPVVVVNATPKIIVEVVAKYWGSILNAFIIVFVFFLAALSKNTPEEKKSGILFSKHVWNRTLKSFQCSFFTGAHFR